MKYPLSADCSLLADRFLLEFQLFQIPQFLCLAKFQEWLLLSLRKNFLPLY